MLLWLCGVQAMNAQDHRISFAELRVLSADASVLPNPTAGGINSGQFSEIDLNLDGVLDLVVFDRTSNKLATYIYEDNAYRYRPMYEYAFPGPLINWVLLRDYDCDGFHDLFTSTSLGIRVYRNTSAATGTLSWAPVADPLVTLGNSPINLFVNSTDLPAIADVDGDQDMDVLVFNFATGGFVEYHQNLSMEKYGTCDSLEFVRVTREWGDFQECFCGSFAFGEAACDGTSRALHVSGKALTVADLNRDGLQDIVFGEEACGDLFTLINEGTIETARFVEAQVPFPELTDQLFFPAAYFLDLDHDGRRDLVLSPNDRGNENDLHDFSASVFTAYQHESSSFTSVNGGFLQSGMIDVGERASPALGDVDGDGDEDLLIGNRGSTTDRATPARLYYFENTGSAAQPIFILRSSDFLNLSALGLSYMRPKLKDLNRDGRVDLVFSATDGPVTYLYILEGSTDGFDLSTLNKINAPLNELDQYDLHDINRDGNTDILVSTSGGRLDLYLNSGTNLSPVYELEALGFLNLTVNPFRTHLSVAVRELGTQLALITYDDSGELRFFDELNAEATAVPLLIEEVGSASRLGRVGSLALGAPNAQGEQLLLVGSIQGGVSAFTMKGLSTGVPPGEDWQVNIYPNPTQGRVFLQSDQPAIGKVINVSGQVLLRDFEVSASFRQELDLSYLSPGIYILQLSSSRQMIRHLKIVIRE